ncbi:iron ABC transporter permease [Arthrobacter sp. APC 3897]|uniref:ABC transporter permease n=1 Tax=Arthrobacter sp. APC 3897 TaxID=3035204 RepID=UPI0025B3C51A|nr:iron ABC transporter permease [Arthrobacter sp. APC 3897]MDN3480891.1 iron ABC transporter permease [Arthrobacter sp. APC 3897]
MKTSVKSMWRSPLVVVTSIVLVWFISTFLILPNINLLTETFFPKGEFSGRAVEKLLSSDRAMKSLANSFILAVVLSVTVNAVGIFIVLVTQYFDIRGARILWLGYATTLIYGGIVLVAGYKFIYGQNGFVTNLLLEWFPGLNPAWFSGFFAVVFVMTFSTTSNHMLFLSSALNKVDYQTIEAARNMGASTLRILWRIVLPMMRPMLFAITILVFLGGLSALTAPQVLGGENFQTISPMILTFSGTSTSRDIAALLALILGLATVVMLAVMSRVERGGTYFSVSKVSAGMKKQKIENPVANALVHVAAYALFLVYSLPILLIVVFSFTDTASISSATLSWDRFTLDNYITVFTDESAFRPFAVSVIYSAVAAVLVVVGLLFVARMVQKFRNPVTTAAEYLLHIPWILPSTLIALGLIMTFDRPSPLIGGQVLTGTVWVLLAAYIIIKIPFTLRMLKAAFYSISDSLEDASAILGAKSLYTFRRVLLPIVLPTAAAITALNFNSLLDDYDTAVFLYHPLYEPLGIVIKNSTQGENISDAMALTFVYTVLLMIIMGTTMYLVYGRSVKTRKRRRAVVLPDAPAQPATQVQPAAPAPDGGQLTKL